MKKKVTSVCLTLCLIFAGVVSARAGGAIETIDVTGDLPSPIPGDIIGRLVGIKWDARCIPVSYTMNTSLDPIPNPLGAPILTAAQAQAALQASFDAWNDIPTSFIDMRIRGTTNKTTVAGFDFINELTFRTSVGFSAIAASASAVLIEDVTLVDGDRIDGDLDSDVSGTITVCTDVDNDGDIEFPAGFYKAGTILENDVFFNTRVNGLRFTVDDALADVNPRSVDLEAVAIHEFGHSHGLAHSFINQLGRNNGGGATMFWFLDTGDPADELSQASLSMDDIAYSSFFYPEGTASSGPAALQPGDIAFDQQFGLITGELRHGVLNQPIAGGSVFAVDWHTGDVIGSALSGTSQVSVNPLPGEVLLGAIPPFSVINPAFSILNGRYVIPVPRGNYAVGVEAVDGSPASAARIQNLTCLIGAIFGQQNFNEEFWNNNLENGVELRLGQRKQISIQPGTTQSGIDITTADSINLNNFGNVNFIGVPNPSGGPFVPGNLYAVQIPGSQITSINPGQDILIQGVAFETAVFDRSVAPIYAQAALTTGVVNPDNSVTIDLANPLEVTAGFLGQDFDFAPFYFNEPQALGRMVRSGTANGTIENLFIVLQVPTTTPFAGVSGVPPLFGLDGGVAVNDAPIFGRSFQSVDGGATWIRDLDFNYRFSLVLSQPVTPPGQQ